MWRASVLTIFPEMFPGPLATSLAGKAQQSGIWSLDTHDIRSAATDKHRTVDDTPAGGGPGMVMKADVLARALDGVPHDTRPRLLMSPRGVPLTQAKVAELACGLGAVIVCARFEGVDERLIKARKLEEVSLGDFVLSGGEIAALALIDACVRLLPGVMGKEASAAEESFADGLLEYPQYTRPPVFEGAPIPEVLSSGDHGKIAAWRREQAENLTRDRRPDLWGAYLAKKKRKDHIGPHEGRELALMRTGSKPLSMFLLDEGVDKDRYFPESEFDALVSDNRLIKKEKTVTYVSPAGDEVKARRVLYALPEETWRIDAMLALEDLYDTLKPGWREDLERLIGHLLGYDQDDIEAFVANLSARKRP